MPSAGAGIVDFKRINSDMKPSTPNVFDLGGEGAEWRNVRIGNDLVVGGALTVQGPITTIESITLVVADKNIELASTPSPTDALADGGGITLKGDTDKTILWKDSTNSWDFNQAIRIGNLELNGNTLSTLTGDLDITTQTGGVFKFNSDAFRSGLDANNYLEMGHGGSNSFLNQVGAGGIDFRFEGNTKATFTPAGHLHLQTDVDQKHTLKIITANNLNDTGIAWENSGGSFTHTIFRTDVGSNRADLVFAAGLNSNIDLLTNSFKIHGEAADEGKLEVIGTLQISSGNPGDLKVLTSDATGIATWVLPAGGGFTDVGATIILTDINDSVGIGESSPDTKLHVTDGGTAGVVTAFPGTIATFESPGNGFLSILTPDAGIRGILFGEPSSNIAGGIFYNDPGSPNGFQFRVNGNVTKMVIESDGRAAFGTTNPDVTALLDLTSTTKGFLPPRMTTTQIDAIASPATGLESYDTTINKKKVFTGAEFKTLLTEDIGQVLIQETFASSNVRFFGELALPAAQGWTDTPTGIATIDLV
ncbi:MAG: hypothetical protein IH899_02345, partial [Planctomycetes bacterium]|nr:hypothetical protein [Planctomycetota bacterium]